MSIEKSDALSTFFVPTHSIYQILTALFYGCNSLMISLVAKVVLTNFGFPSFPILAFCEMSTCLFFVQIAHILGLVVLPPLDVSTVQKVLPLSIFFVLNLLSGLGGTQKTKSHIFLPMFIALRHITILLTMILEYFVLGQKPTITTKISVALIIFGSFVAAIFDLTFELFGYLFVLINDILTAANGVYTKKRLDAKNVGMFGLLYYNSFFMLPFVLLIILFRNDVQQVQKYFGEGNLNISFLFFFALLCIVAFTLNLSIVLCMSYNSALTTACVGPIKNIVVTYIGMFMSGDYIFDWPNFIGLNISLIGTIIYVYITFLPGKPVNERAKIPLDFKSQEKENLIPSEDNSNC